MKLETVRIKRFRSIEAVCLEGIGQLNVLIGKNNSGKSNILLSIDAFFGCIKGGNLVTAEPPIGSDIDYFGKRAREPIEIELSFSIHPSERGELVQDIVRESPQMKNAAEAINPASEVTASVRVIAQPRRAAFVSEISLRNPGESSEKGAKLLSVPNEAAIELLSKTIGSSRATRQAS